MVDCTVHLVTLQGEVDNEQLNKHLRDSYIIKGRAHGWIHEPHQPHHEQELLQAMWQLFLVTRQSKLPPGLINVTSKHESFRVSIPQSQYDQLESQIGSTPKPNSTTPPLPGEWRRSPGIPSSAILDEEPNPPPLEVGELQLTPKMAKFLKTQLPHKVQNDPVSLFNLFKYPRGDSGVHDHYMEGFKSKFGDSAGAAVKFMGPIVSEGNHSKSEQSWNDANLVQYDTIWHYAYMLSTDVYAELNKEKISGLEDTAILLVSEIEMAKT